MSICSEPLQAHTAGIFGESELCLQRGFFLSHTEMKASGPKYHFSPVFFYYPPIISLFLMLNVSEGAENTQPRDEYYACRQMRHVMIK